MHVQNMAELAATTTGRTKPYHVGEIAEMLDVHSVTIYRDIKAGRLRALRVGVRNGIRVLPPDLAAYLQLLAVPTETLAEVA